jgi:uncharacterized repeat protein (TIGR02543 family)
MRAIVIPESVQFIGEWAFSSAQNLTVFGIEGSYAHTYAANNGIEFTPINSTYKFKVSYNLNGGAGVTPQPQETEPGFSIQKPTNPTRHDYNFTGWYQNAACTIPWNFASHLVMNDMTLFAGWEKIRKPGDIFGTGEPSISGVLEILKHLAGMPSALDNEIAYKAACITGSIPTIADVLEILKYLAGMDSALRLSR